MLRLNHVSSAALYGCTCAACALQLGREDGAESHTSKSRRVYTNVLGIVSGAPPIPIGKMGSCGSAKIKSCQMACAPSAAGKSPRRTEAGAMRKGDADLNRMAANATTSCLQLNQLLRDGKLLRLKCVWQRHPALLSHAHTPLSAHHVHGHTSPRPAHSSHAMAVCFLQGREPGSWSKVRSSAGRYAGVWMHGGRRHVGVHRRAPVSTRGNNNLVALLEFPRIHHVSHRMDACVVPKDVTISHGSTTCRDKRDAPDCIIFAQRKLPSKEEPSSHE